jgi:hypothetical protein
MSELQKDDLIAELIELALELGANPFHVNKILFANGVKSIQEAVSLGYIAEEKEGV